MARLLTCLPVALLFTKAMAADNGLAVTPQMGWNNWNAFGCDVDEELVLDTASAMKYLGLQDVGYHYVVVDDCWSDGRDGDDKLQPDTTKFPNGMADVGDKLHAQGFGFGMYSDAGNATCAGYAGSLGYETEDADTFASWGVDYLKYDNCNNEGLSGSEEISSKRYNTMAKALNSTERDILYSICNWGEDNPWSWGPSIGNSWRISGDITDSFDEEYSGCHLPDSGGYACSVVRILNKAEEIAPSGSPGGWNDLDMLEVGNGGMSDAEYKTHFSMWSLLKSPLILGTDIPTLSAADLSILTNPAIIAVNQDPEGTPVKNVWVDGDAQLWTGSLSQTIDPLSHDTVVALLNTGSTTKNITASIDDIFGLGAGAGDSKSAPSAARSAAPRSGDWEIRDLWAARLNDTQAQSIIDDGAAAHADLLYNATETPYATGLGDGEEMLIGKYITLLGTDRELTAAVEGHGCAIYRLRPVA